MVASETATASNATLDTASKDGTVSEMNQAEPTVVTELKQSPSNQDEAQIQRSDGDVASPREPPTLSIEATIRIRSASVRELVHQKRDITLSFENLTVHVPASGWNGGGCCTSKSNTLLSPVKQFAQEYLGMTTELGEPFYALQDVSGYIQTGEKILVVGSANENTSILIRALTGRLTALDTDLSGTLLVNGQV